MDHSIHQKTESDQIELHIGQQEENLVKNLQKWHIEQTKVKTEKKFIELNINDIDEELVQNLQKWEEQQEKDKNEKIKAEEKIKKIRDLKRINYMKHEKCMKRKGEKMTIKQKFEIYHSFRPSAQQIDKHNGTTRESGKTRVQPKTENLEKQKKGKNMGTTEILTKQILLAEAMDAIDTMTFEPVSSADRSGEAHTSQHQPGGGWQNVNEKGGRSMTNHGGKIESIIIDNKEFSLPIGMIESVQKERSTSDRRKMVTIIRKHKKAYLVVQMEKVRAKILALQRLQSISKFKKKDKENRKESQERKHKIVKSQNRKITKSQNLKIEPKSHCINPKSNKVIFLGSKTLGKNDKIFQCKCIVMVTRINVTHTYGNNQPCFDMYSRIKSNRRKKRQMNHWDHVRITRK